MNNTNIEKQLRTNQQLQTPQQINNTPIKPTRNINTLQIQQECKFLESILKSRAKERVIFQIKDNTGNPISDKENIAKRLNQDQYDLKKDNEPTHMKLFNGWSLDKETIKELEIDRPNCKSQIQIPFHYSSRKKKQKKKNNLISNN
ncbi:hypothetical protein ACTA71_007871 [Dictyostelium dimigraforme]